MASLGSSSHSVRSILRHTFRAARTATTHTTTASRYLAQSTRTMSSTTTTLANPKPWPTRVVESHGDYREEAWLEELDANRDTTYQHQPSLPSLPVPTIEETLERFLPTALPLAESKAEQKALEKCVANFPAQAQQLQERLLARASKASTNSSWLQHWWNTLGYLQVRDSVCINVSYYFQFRDDPTIHRTDTASSQKSTPQIRRAASLLYASGQYRNQVASGSLAPETLGRKQTPLCMTAYKYMFHACRIPQLEQDSYRIYDPAVFRHAVVVSRGRFYRVPLIDETTGGVLSVETLESHLATLVEDASEKEEASSDPLRDLGYLTGDNRDAWATARAQLLQLDGMEAALETLESGCVLVALDDVDSPVSRAQCGKQWLYGNGSAKNRWFDKSVQLIVCPNGKAGLLGEHSMMDGMPVVGLANHIVKTSYQSAVQQSAAAATASSLETYGRVVDIFGGLSATPEIAASIASSKTTFEEWTRGKHELDVQSFYGYGSDFMKKAGFSPDAYAQMAMQVATVRLFGKQVGTYEATQTRVFRHGRTETTRTVSPTSAAFVRSLVEPNHKLTASDKVALLEGACQTHSQYIRKAAQGMGVDRHFLGLSLLAQTGERLPDLYSDPVFVRSKRWRVSTSNLTHPGLDNWGYGEVVPDGVGLSYSVHKNHLVFGITALKEHGGWPQKLSQYLEDALVDMKLLIEAKNAEADAAAAAPKRSKL